VPGVMLKTNFVMYEEVATVVLGSGLETATLTRVTMPLSVTYLVAQ
jgi:hypothetical protein